MPSIEFYFREVFAARRDGRSTLKCNTGLEKISIIFQAVKKNCRTPEAKQHDKRQPKRYTRHHALAARSPLDGVLPLVPPTVVLYTRTGCHLCDDAKATLLRYGLNPKEVDIDADEDLRAQFDVWVPVVEIDGQVRFKGRVDEFLLRRLLLARESLP